MDYLGFWKNLNIFGDKSVPVSKADLTGTVHYDIGGFGKLRRSNIVSFRAERSSSLNRKRHLSGQENRSTPIEKPQAVWRKFCEDPENRRADADSVTVDLDTDDIIELEPPMKRSRMEAKQFQSSSSFNDAKDVEIVKVVNGSKPLKKLCMISKRSLTLGFLKKRKSTIAMEEQREDKRKYAELLRNHVYCQVNRSKRPAMSHSTFDLALQVVKSQTPDVNNVKRVPEVVDLSEEKKEVTVMPTRVQVDRRRTITPVTQATEKPDRVVEKTATTKKNLLPFMHKPNAPYLDPNFIVDLKANHLKSLQEAREEIENEKKKSEMCGKINMAKVKQKRAKMLEDLDKQMKDYLKITESFPEEIEAEIIPPLPELTPQMQREIDSALARGNPGEVLADAFNLKIQRRDIHTLQGLNWLNDEVINFYMNLLMDRGKQEKYPSVYAFNTFFYPKLISGGHSVLKRWTKKVDIFSYDFVLVPVHLGVHWCMAIIDMGKKCVMYFDSMGGRNEQCLTALKQYLSAEKMDKKSEKFETSEWEFCCMKDIPQQMNGSDCGMFSCMFAEYTSRRTSISFTQQDMPYFRRKMIYEIIKTKLLC